jgi:YD repeat-containing protein
MAQLTLSRTSTILDYRYTYSATQNDGRITQRKDWVSGEEISYQYDSLQRLISAVTTGPQWGLSFGYDGFGNLLSKTVTKGSGPALSVSVNPANNRMYGYGYL